MVTANETHQPGTEKKKRERKRERERERERKRETERKREIERKEVENQKCPGQISHHKLSG